VDRVGALPQTLARSSSRKSIKGRRTSAFASAKHVAHELSSSLDGDHYLLFPKVRPPGEQQSLAGAESFAEAVAAQGEVLRIKALVAALPPLARHARQTGAALVAACGDLVVPGWLAKVREAAAQRRLLRALERPAGAQPGDGGSRSPTSLTGRSRRSMPALPGFGASPRRRASHKIAALGAMSPGKAEYSVIAPAGGSPPGGGGQARGWNRARGTVAGTSGRDEILFWPRRSPKVSRTYKLTCM
jgi:hypothetical protein